jgi:type IV pilus assembly protein PilA
MLLQNRRAMGHRDRSGFTMVEIMIVVLLIALLSAIALPGFRKARTQTQLTNVANDITVFGDAFDLYALERGGYPPDYHLGAPYNLPNAAMEEYLNGEKWAATTSVGGNYNWEGPDSCPYAGISIFGATASEDVMRQLDEIMDDGDLTSGMFRKVAANNRYTYILEE